MPPCKGHKKSRTGCRVCKRRRIKCDETRPRCRNCVKYSAACDFDSSSPGDGGAYSASSSSLSLSFSIQPDRSSLAMSLPTPASSTYLSSSPQPTASPSHCSNPSYTSTSSTSSAFTSSSSAQPSTYVCTTTTTTTSSSSLSLQYPGALPAAILIPTTFPSVSVPIHASSSLSVTDLTLLHHFTISTSLTLHSNPELQKLWSHTIPRLGSRSDRLFILHSILALAGIHIGTPQMLETAKRHYAAALAGMAKQLAEGVQEENCQGLFIVVQAMTVYSIAIDDNDNVPGSGMNQLCPPTSTTWISLIRGSFGILQKSWKWIMRPPLMPMFQLHPALSGRIGLSQGTEERLQDLMRLCTDYSLPGATLELDESPDSAPAYFMAIKNLRQVYAMIESVTVLPESESPDDDVLGEGTDRGDSDAIVHAISQYVLRTPSKFWDMLAAKRARALVVYAYLSVAWEGVGKCWSRGKAKRDVERIERLLIEKSRSEGEGWEKWVQWPKTLVSGSIKKWMEGEAGSREGGSHDSGYEGEEHGGEEAEENIERNDNWMLEILELDDAELAQWGR